MRAELPENQAERLRALHSFGILDTPREIAFDEIVAFAAKLCDVPISVVNLIDENRQWFKAEVGLGVRETPLQTSLCAHAILEQDLLVVPDTLQDARFCDNPLCLDAPHLRFYAGAILRTQDGFALGTLCVLDQKPRELSHLQIEGLRVLSRQVMMQLELGRSLARADVLAAEIDHRVKNSLALVSGLLSAQARASGNAQVKEQLEVARDRVLAVADVHEQLQLTTKGSTVDLGPFLRRFVSRLAQTAPAGVAVTIETENVEVRTQQASAVAVLVNELATNAFRHAFPDGTGRVDVSLALRGGDILLAVADDGTGLPDPSRPVRKGVGTRVISAIAKQLAGQLTYPRAQRGTTVQVQFRPSLIED